MSYETLCVDGLTTSEGVQTLFFDETAERTKNLVWGQDYMRVCVWTDLLIVIVGHV